MASFEHGDSRPGYRSIGAAVNIEMSNVGLIREALNIAIAERTVN